MELISDRWWLAGKLLSPSFDKDRDRAGSAVASCERVFSQWIKSNGHEDYPLSWDGLQRLVFRMGKRIAAEKLFKVLKNKDTKYVDTMSVII